LSYAEVIFIPHKKNEIFAEFIELEAGNKRLRLSMKHLVYASGNCDGKYEPVRARDVKKGTCLALDVDDSLVGAQIVGVNVVKSHGMYTVVTTHPDGNIVVSGFKVSSFAVNHHWVNAYYGLHRVLHQHFPSVLQSELLFSANNILGSVAGKILAPFF